MIPNFSQISAWHKTTFSCMHLCQTSCLLMLYQIFIWLTIGTSWRGTSTYIQRIVVYFCNRCLSPALVSWSTDVWVSCFIIALIKWTCLCHPVKWIYNEKNVTFTWKLITDKSVWVMKLLPNHSWLQLGHSMFNTYYGRRGRWGVHVFTPPRHHRASSIVEDYIMVRNTQESFTSNYPGWYTHKVTTAPKIPSP